MSDESEEGNEEETEEDFTSPLTPLLKGEGKKEYIILVPSTACRQDLVDVKTYLE